MDLQVPDGTAPWFVRIADAVVRDIERGRLAPGDRLPGTRALARQLGVNRNTVVAAFAELEAQGWVVATGGSGTRVAEVPPRPPPRRNTAREPGYALPPAPPLAVDPPGPLPASTLRLSGGRPNLTLVPVDALGRAWRAGLRTRARTLLDYGDPRGHPRLRAALSRWLADQRGLVPDPDGVLITRGCQQALDLAARALLRPGDRVAVEALGYAPAWAALRSAGAELVPIEVDDHGLRVDRLAEVAAQGPLRAVYVTPHHQFPTMRVLPAPRRLALLDLATRHRLLVLEDDYDHEFHYTGRPVWPLAHRDPAGVVLYLGTFSKVLAPGLRMGFVVGPPQVIDRLAQVRTLSDRQGDLPMEHAVATLVEDGTLRRHLRKARRVYAARQARFSEALACALGDRIAFDVPAGGLALWVRWHGDVEGFAARALAQGVWVQTARSTHIDGQVLPFFRAGFASLDDAAIDAACARLARAGVTS